MNTNSLSQNPVGGIQRPRKRVLPVGFGACSKALFAIALVFLLATSVDAALYSVSAPPVSFAIGFTGVVDTSTDTFMLTSVTDGAGGNDFWTIAANVTMNAFDSGGVPYDVPDAWNGTINGTWGFVGPLLSGVTFNEGLANGTWSDWTTGWGAMINSVGTYITSQTQNNAMANWPYTSSNGNGYWITQPGHGTLTVTQIPEPGTFALSALGLLGCTICGLRWRWG